MKLYLAGHDSINLRALSALTGGQTSHGLLKTQFVRTGEKRAPRKGEWYLSGAIPEAWIALNNLGTEFHILRPATAVEVEQSKLLEQMERLIAAKRQENLHKQ